MSTIATPLNSPKDLILAQLLFGGLIFIGIIIKVIGSFLPPGSSIGEATITVWGYIIILFSLLGLIIIQIDANENPYTQLNQIPYSVYVLAVIVLWIIILNITYTKYINKGSIPPTYTFWNKWSTIFIGIITILILMQLFGKINEKKPSNLNNEYLNKMFEFLKSQETTINVYLGFILFLNVLIAGIQTTILANFRVDG